MERLLEFRAWHKPTGVMHENVAFNQGQVYVPWEGCYRPLPRAECELMQFTGELDQQGIKIFEGDIVRFTYRVPQIKLTIADYYAVSFRQGCFGLVETSGSSFNPIKDIRVNEVAGHVFLNRDLLQTRFT